MRRATFLCVALLAGCPASRSMEVDAGRAELDASAPALDTSERGIDAPDSGTDAGPRPGEPPPGAIDTVATPVERRWAAWARV